MVPVIRGECHTSAVIVVDHVTAVPLPFPPAVIDRLAHAATLLRRFLARVHFAHRTVPGFMPGALYHPTEAFNLALARYEKVWMPLLASLKNVPGAGAEKIKLAAPLDVQWMHHLHRLDPCAYRADCEQGFGELIDPSDPFLCAGDGTPAADAVAETNARQAWQNVSPDSPFDLADALREYRETGGCFPEFPNSNSMCDSNESSNHACFSVSSDVRGAATRQGGFLYQILPPRYADRTFIRAASERYAKLVALWREFPDEFLVPTYDMDLVWHAHLSTPSAYAREMKRVTGRLVGHDDGVNDRTAGAKLDVSGRMTKTLWHLTYGPADQYAMCGTMWRGDPPDWYWTCGGFNVKKFELVKRTARVPPAGAVCESAVAANSPTTYPVTHAANVVCPIPIAVELAPGVFYAPARPDLSDASSRKNQLLGFSGTFEGFVQPPFNRQFDNGVQYAAVRVYGAPAAGPGPTVRETWVNFAAPMSMFPVAFQQAHRNAFKDGQVECSFHAQFPIQPCGAPLKFITPIDLRAVIHVYETRRLCFAWCCCGLCALFGALCGYSTPARSDYGLGLCDAAKVQNTSDAGACGARAVWGAAASRAPRAWGAGAGETGGDAAEGAEDAEAEDAEDSTRFPPGCKYVVCTMYMCMYMYKN